MSYLDHFKLNKQPFRLTPEPGFVYWSKQHARAKAYMESTIWLADGFVVITGDIGSGKTTLLKSFLAQLDDDVVCAMVSQTQLTPTQFLQAVLTEFGFKPFNKRKVELLHVLNMFLIEQYSSGKKVLLIVDEAQNLSRRVLEEIRMLAAVEPHGDKILRIVLAGHADFRNTLDSAELKQLLQRVRLRFHIEPLDRPEMHEYIDHRLTVAGCGPNKIFAEASYETLYRYTGGLPRLINILCDAALLHAFSDDDDVVMNDHVMSAVAELNWNEHESTTGRFTQLREIAHRPVAASCVTEIEVREDGRTVAVHSFPMGRIILGRSPDNEIYMKSKFVSRHHAQLVSDDNGCLIEDLNSTNGVFIGEKQVKIHRLRDGDIVSLGVHELVYRDLRAVRNTGDEGAKQDASGSAVDHRDDQSGESHAV